MGFDNRYQVRPELRSLIISCMVVQVTRTNFRIISCKSIGLRVIAIWGELILWLYKIQLRLYTILDDYILWPSFVTKSDDYCQYNHLFARMQTSTSVKIDDKYNYRCK